MSIKGLNEKEKALLTRSNLPIGRCWAPVVPQRRPKRLKSSNNFSSPPVPLVLRSDVSFGFKAPVTLLLFPWWAHLLPKVKLLHVVRDGRDIAFSHNQSPVQKYYHLWYKTNSDIADTLAPADSERDWDRKSSSQPARERTSGE